MDKTKNFIHHTNRWSDKILTFGIRPCKPTTSAQAKVKRSNCIIKSFRNITRNLKSKTIRALAACNITRHRRVCIYNTCVNTVTHLNRSRKRTVVYRTELFLRISLRATRPNFSPARVRRCFIVLDCFPRINKIIRNTYRRIFRRCDDGVCRILYSQLGCVYTQTRRCVTACVRREMWQKDDGGWQRCRRNELRNAIVTERFSGEITTRAIICPRGGDGCVHIYCIYILYTYCSKSWYMETAAAAAMTETDTKNGLVIILFCIIIVLYYFAFAAAAAAAVSLLLLSGKNKGLKTN